MSDLIGAQRVYTIDQRTMTTRHIIHVDMDAFYASVEQLDNPTLRHKPVIVGGDTASRGVVSAASYEARVFGVHSAMPMKRAVSLCPQAVVLPVRMPRYLEFSQRIRRIMEAYTPLVEPLSVDEAFLDVTGSVRLLGEPAQIASRIKEQIRDETGLTASIGLAPNKFLAKLASDLEKPDGLVIVAAGREQEFLAPLPVSRIWGVGKVAAANFTAHGIETIGQLRNTPLSALEQMFGNAALHLSQLARGVDDRPVEVGRQARSISSERTFRDDIGDCETLKTFLIEQVEEVAFRLRCKDLESKTITLKLRYGDFRTITRSSTLAQPTNTTEYLLTAALAVFEKWRKQSLGPLRLIGFSASQLTESSARSDSLFPDPQEEKHKRLDSAVDLVNKRFGPRTLRRGR